MQLGQDLDFLLVGKLFNSWGQMRILKLLQNKVLDLLLVLLFMHLKIKINV